MPVLESTDRAMPRSALRHRPIESDGSQQGKTSISPVAQRASRLKPPQTEEDGEQGTAGRPSTSPSPKTPRLIRTGGRRRGMLRAHPLLLLGLGMILMLVLWTLLTLAVSWWNTTSFLLVSSRGSDNLSCSPHFKQKHGHIPCLF